MNLLTIPQHSHEWFQARIGCVTGSRVSDALSMLKRSSNGRAAGEPSQARIDYMMECALGRLTGMVEEHYVTPAMDWGIEQEDRAVAAYEAVSDNKTSKVGIATHPRIERFLASPDRLVGDAGVLEVKGPTSPVHLSYLKAGIIPPAYEYQCMAELACTEREWLDFVSFDPRFPVRLQVFIARMVSSEWAVKIEAMEEGVRKFLAEVAALTDELQQLAKERGF